jgi:hypothetical protein
MKNAIYLVLLFGAIVWTVSSFTKDTMITDGSDTRNLDNFSIVSVSAGIQVTLVNSTSTKVELETRNCEPEDVITKVEGDRLTIKFKKNKGGKRKVYATVYYKELEGLDASSGSSIKTDNEIKSDEMDINASSGASINLVIDCTELEVDLSSGSSVKIKGECGVQDVDISSGASYQAIDLVSETADISASSGGSAKIHVTKELKAEASSGGNITYKGDPQETDIEKSISGSVKKM